MFKEDTASYIELVELHFAANYVEKDNEVATLTAVNGWSRCRWCLLSS